MTRQSRVWWVRFPHSPAIAIVLALAIAWPNVVRGQGADSARAGIAQPKSAKGPRDPLLVPPISPGRAFLFSLLLPGYSQIKLDRPRAAILFGLAEVAAIGMARKSALDLREARRGAKDSVILTFQTDPITGVILVDPVTGKQKGATFAPNRYTPKRIAARRTHYEDWIAAIAFNHLIAATDAYVAANLWDFPVNIRGGVSERKAQVIATLSW